MAARRMTVAALTAALSLMWVGAVAFACNGVVSAPYASASPNQAASGAQVTVSGGQWVQTETVQVRWDSTTGTVLATATVATDRSFSRSVVIPTVPAGSYALVVVQRDTTEVVSFDVVAATTSSSGTSSPVSGPAQTIQSPAAAPAEAAPAAGAAPAAASTVPAASSGAASTVTADSSGAASPAPSASSSAGARAVASTRPAAGSGPTASAVAAPAADPAAEARLSPRTLTQDLWSALGDGDTNAPAGLGAAEHPSSSPLSGTVALAVVGAGVVALFGGFALAELGRRRSLATHTTRRSQRLG